MNETDRKIAMSSVEEIEEKDMPSELPIFMLRSMVVYPSTVVPLVASREKSVKLIDDVVAGSRMIGIVSQKDSDIDDPTPSDVYQVGTLAVIHRMMKLPDGSVRVLVQGLSRIKVKKYIQEEPYFKAEAEILNDIVEEGLELNALATSVSNQFQKIVWLVPYLSDELQVVVVNLNDPSKLADFVASNLNLRLEQKQDLLETVDIKERLTKLTRTLEKQVQELDLASKIQSQVQNEMGKAQKEFLLREQLKAIQRELGEGDERTIEMNELRAKVEKAGMPEEVEKVAEKELGRLSKMPPAAAEYTVSRTYLDWLVELPWSVYTEDNLEIKSARQVLDDDHYDLNDVKNRIIEYLAVRKIKQDMKGPILCFVGPPGVGKTSLGRSIARALGRKFVRISLGGVRDEAEIRGHRRTYVGALPGRIIQGIRKAGSNNPIFMMDEIDKLGADFRGDPSAALLEVLDPEQNNSFSDHYLEVPFDLSKVMFITTANILDTIPPALRDRMEVLRLPGYTEEEKVMIAKKHLMPKQFEEHGLSRDQVSFTDSAIKSIIKEYTKEAGLRNLEREIANVCRKVATKVAEGREGPFRITSREVRKSLGPKRFYSETAERITEPGIATGLAWTMSGGDILFIESIKMKGGKRGLILTGQLGDVMKESAHAALSYFRARASEFGIDEDFFKKYDIHIHVPEGAVPKDGPSAGVAIATSLASLLTGRPVHHDVAMTGEITLRGKVLPVGGIKEKVLAAQRARIKTVILPKWNEKDLEEIPPNIRKKLNFSFVEKLDEVIHLALTGGELEAEEERREDLALKS